MSKKQFLSLIAAFFGLAVLSRLPFIGTARRRTATIPNSYGHAPYGGSSTK